MKIAICVISGAIIFLLVLNSCHPGNSPDKTSISTDTATISKGDASFVQYCSSCHNFRQDEIGPNLAGLTDSVPAEWIQNFIRDPNKLLESGDERAQKLIKKYKTAMPPFSYLTGNEINGIIAFLNTHKKNRQTMAKDDGKALSNPIPDTIQLSNLVGGLELVTQFPSSADNGKGPKARITKLDFEPNSGNTFILDLRGKLYKMQGNKPFVYMDIARLEPKFIQEPGLATGFGSFAFHPEFAKNGLLYTTHTEAAGSAKADFNYADSIKVTLQWVLTEWKTGQPGAATFSGKGRELFRVNMVSGIHGVQEITFNPLSRPGDADYNLLYIGIGDGGSVEEGFQFLAHSKDKVWGTILRIDPTGSNSANGHYGIPKNNPFVKGQNTNTLGEIYAYGFRNPHRITWTKSGEMLACNIGHANIESVNLIMPGHDYGWPLREGNFVMNAYGNMSKVYPLPANDSVYNITYPVAEYDHNGGVAAISGGYEYGGRAVPQLAGKYIFGDIASGRLFFINTADIKQGKQAIIKEWRISLNGSLNTLAGLCGSSRADLHFGKDAKGEMYILTKTDGKVYKLVSASMRP